MVSRRAVLAAGAALSSCAMAPRGLRISGSNDNSRRSLWARDGGPRLRGAVFVQRRVYPELDGPDFLGAGPVGAPVTDAALDSLADAGANLASWSGPGPFAERAPFRVDWAIADHIEAWLERCASRGLFTTLCFRSGPGRSAFAFHPDDDWYPARLYDASLWDDAEKQAAWIAMVDWTFERFGAHPALAGVVALEEPNASDLGRSEVWLRMAAELARADEARIDGPALMLSPDRWARLEQADRLRSAVGPRPVLITHDYSPWRYTHAPVSRPEPFDPGAAGPVPARSLGPAGVLEFGAPRWATDLELYLADRINAYEAQGLNWAVYRWTNGWATYESVEGSRALSLHDGALRLLRRMFSANTLRPTAD